MATRQGPGDAELKRLIDLGWSYQQIADQYGVTRSSIAKIASRAGLSKQRIRYRVAELWAPVHDKHAAMHTLNMLRAVERRQKGEELDSRTRGRLDSFLTNLESTNGVVVYAPELDEGFFVMDRDDFPEEVLDHELPVVNRRVTLESLSEMVGQRAKGGSRGKPRGRTQARTEGRKAS